MDHATWYEHTSYRGTGRTTRALNDLPIAPDPRKPNLYVVRSNSERDYVNRLLAEKVRRDDVIVKTWEWVEREAFRGAEFQSAVCDHDLMFTTKQEYDLWNMVRFQVR
jgi:hypothetical protein